jgi:hypothetical protein
VADLLDDLVAKPQRETAGSGTAARFDYQKSWAFCQMLHRHMEGADYLVAFEFHEDVVFIDPDISKNSAEFFQIKTSSSAKPRKLTDLTKRKSDAVNSILGKMFQNFTGIWSQHSVQVVLVSNVAFEFADKDVAAADIDPKVRKKIVDKLTAELPNFEEKQVDNLHFMVTGVSIEAMQTYLHGKALDLFKSHFGEGHGFNVHSWVRLIQSEITRRNNHTSDVIGSVADLISKKCIDKGFVTQSLGVLAANARSPLDMTIVNADLSASGWSATNLMRLTKRMATATADFSDSSNLEAAKLVQSLEDLFESLLNTTLANFIVEAETNILPKLSSPYSDKFYLAAMCVLVFNEKL